MTFWSQRKTAWKANFKIYDVTDWLTSNYNTHLNQYVKKWRQSSNETWSANRIWYEKHFSWKIVHKIWWTKFSKKSKLSISLDQQSKVLYSLSLLYAKLRTIEIYWSKAVWSGASLPASFSAWFLKKNISLVIFYCLMKFHCFVVFTSCNNGQNAYWNCFLARFWHHRYWS